MPNGTIDLRKLKQELKIETASARDLPLSVRLPQPLPPGRVRIPSALIPKARTVEELEVAEAETFESSVSVEETYEGAEAETRALISWDAPEFDYNASSALTLFFMGALLFLGGIAAVFFRSYLFAFFLMIAGGVVISYAYRVPRTVRFAVTSRGIVIGRRLYEFGNLKSFWIAYDPPYSKELVIASKKTVMPLVRAPLGDLDPMRLREVLLRFLKEEEHEDSFVDIVSKRLGF